MPGKKKKFIDKKNAVSFFLGSRSQHDPVLFAGGSENVLLPAAAAAVTTKPVVTEGDRLTEQHKYGIYYDDNYDYLQHLKDVDELNSVEIIDRCRISAVVEKPPMDARLQLPSSVFGSTVETKVGLLNQAARLTGPQLDWDPDIVAALDVDFDFSDAENVLEDDFVALAKGPELDGENELREELDGLFDDEDRAVTVHCRPVMKQIPEETDSKSDEDLSSNMDEDDEGEGDESVGEWDSVAGESKSGLTSYSMSSSVMPRNAGLSLLDDIFEKFAEKYCEEEIGDLSHEDIEGYLKPSSDRMQHLVSQFEKQHTKVTLKDLAPDKSVPVAAINDEHSASDEEMEQVVIMEPLEKWDCETILTTHSTLYNHPVTIKEEKLKPSVRPIKLSKRLEIPSDVLNSRGPTARQLEQEEHNKVNQVVMAAVRRKDETSEERNARKKAVHEMKQERRKQKKATRKAFQDEKLKQDKLLINLQHDLHSVNIV